jgi:hypothetical protein
LRRRGPRSLERHYLRLGALAHQERGSVRHHLAAAVQHRGAQIGRVTELPTVCARTLLGDFELDAVVRRPVAKRAVPDSGTKSFDAIPTAVRFCYFLLVTGSKFGRRAGALMDQDPGTAELSPATKQLSRSTSAVRMLRHRERRRKGLRFLGIELREREIEALIRRDDPMIEGTTVEDRVEARLGPKEAAQGPCARGPVHADLARRTDRCSATTSPP